MKNSFWPILMVLIALMFIHCGKLFRMGEKDKPAIIYELAWIHPKVLISDPKFTLITADRVDSFVVEGAEQSGKSSPSVVFEIFRPGCEVSISLGEQYGSTLGPLLIETFAPGWYKFTLHLRMFDSVELPPGRYILQATSCDSQSRAVFFRD